MVETLLIMLAATALSFVLHEFFIQNNNVSMIYALAVVVVSCITPGYFYGVLAYDAYKRHRRELLLYHAVLGL